MRTGIGFDAHRFDEQRPLVLGGVVIEGAPGLAGHSDGDALTHAVIDALLGAATLGDIGTHFPSDDERWRGARSVDLLAGVAGLLQARGHAIGNVDATVIAERPRLAGHIDRMRGALAAAMGIDAARVSVKATTTDGLGFTGRGEGIAALAVALIE
ncbi:MAG TPA: 2-C-methyl-D-erythritol 2,4-cyclodiphosphate synthase [Dehalococcoidia bacterium]|nr:2-C-methyl-D-erythritol 2,4-cyclodiphosphate synthase [Dehalococcoidia bacterium]